MRNLREREKLLFRYSSALESGDFVTINAILRAAEDDADLMRMIDEHHAALTAEAELTLPQLSRNGQSEDRSMLKSMPVQTTLHDTRPASFSWSYALVSAAVIAMVLFGAAFFSGLPEGENTGAALLQQESETPTPAPLMTATPLPTAVQPANVSAVAELATYLPAIGTGNFLSLCSVTSPDVITSVQTRPGVLSDWRVVGYLPANTTVDVIEIVIDEFGVWYFVVVDLGAQRVQGWAREDQFTGTENCVKPEGDQIISGVPGDVRGNAALEYRVEPGDTLLSIAVRFRLGVDALDQLREINGLTSDSDLRVGMVLSIPAVQDVIQIELVPTEMSPTATPLDITPTATPIGA
jgi:hypothetical protein